MRNTVHLDQEVSPDTVENLEGDKKSVENIVGGEELNVACSIVEGGVEDMGWVYSTPKCKWIAWMTKVQIYVFVVFAVIKIVMF